MFLYADTKIISEKRPLPLVFNTHYINWMSSSVYFYFIFDDLVFKFSASKFEHSHFGCFISLFE